MPDQGISKEYVRQRVDWSKPTQSPKQKLQLVCCIEMFVFYTTYCKKAYQFVWRHQVTGNGNVFEKIKVGQLCGITFYSIGQSVNFLALIGWIFPTKFVFPAEIATQKALSAARQAR